MTARRWCGHLPDRDVSFIVSVGARAWIRCQVSSVFDGGFELSRKQLPELLETADLALVCSGTASLEAALAGVPHELVYRTGAINHFLGRRLVKHPPHRVEQPHPRAGAWSSEHLQDDASPLPLSRALLRWLARPVERQEFYGHARSLRRMCGSPGVWSRTAAELNRMVVAPEAGS